MLTDAPQIKLLGSPSVVCQDENCGTAALFLFRSGKGPIAAYCELHARKVAALFRLELPERPMKRIRAGWKDADALVGSAH